MNKDNINLDFIYIGAPRVASTWLAQCLIEHPDLCVSLKPEFEPFKNSEEVNWEGLKKNLSHCQKEAKKGVMPTGFMTKEGNWEKLLKKWPQIKVIVALRNPIERAYSHFEHDKGRGMLKRKTAIKEAVKERPNIIESGFYYKLIKPYWDNWGKDRILILFYEDIKDKPEEVIKNTYKFLGVSESFKPMSLKKTFNPATERRLYSRKLKGIIDMIIFLGRVVKKIPGGRGLVEIIKKVGGDKFLFWLTRKNLIDVGGTTLKRKDYVIAKDERQWLRGVYEEDIKKLSQLLGRSLTEWK